ncbi:MAG: hypothetical protein ABFS34_09995 [Gemmatimonadota bacterium]
MARSLAGAWAVTLALAAGLSGCDRLGIGGERTLSLPSPDEVRAAYSDHPTLTDVRLNGNVVELTFAVQRRNLRRGGSLWARADLFVQLLSPSTRDLLAAHDGVAAVRAITVTNGVEVGRATLLRDELSELLWQRTLNLLGHALQEGTQRPSLLQDLAEWGEDHTEHQYNPDYVPTAG